jgi:hypothetical protein
MCVGARRVGLKLNDTLTSTRARLIFLFLVATVVVVGEAVTATATASAAAVAQAPAPAPSAARCGRLLLGARSLRDSSYGSCGDSAVTEPSGDGRVGSGAEGDIADRCHCNV